MQVVGAPSYSCATLHDQIVLGGCIHSMLWLLDEEIWAKTDMYEPEWDPSCFRFEKSRFCTASL